MEQKEDLRIQKSKRDLRNAIIELLQEEPFEKITVIDICQRAMINRMTFYKYYEDKYHLFDDTISYFRDLIIQKVPEKIMDNPDRIKTETDYVCLLFELAINEIIKNKDILDMIEKQNSLAIDKIILGVVHDSVFEFLKQINLVHPFKYPVTLISQFVEGGSLKLINYWIDHQDSYPKDKLFKAFKEIIEAISNNNILFKDSSNKIEDLSIDSYFKKD